MNYLHNYHIVTDTGKNQRAYFLIDANLPYYFALWRGDD